MLQLCAANHRQNWPKCGISALRGVCMSTQPPRSGGCIENAQDRPTEELTVRIWGLGTNGRAFSQNASLKNLTATSAVVGGLLQEIAVNEVIGLQFRDVKTRVQIVWMDNQ